MKIDFLLPALFSPDWRKLTQVFKCCSRKSLGFLKYVIDIR